MRFAVRIVFPDSRDSSKYAHAECHARPQGAKPRHPLDRPRLPGVTSVCLNSRHGRISFSRFTGPSRYRGSKIPVLLPRRSTSNDRSRQQYLSLWIPLAFHQPGPCPTRSPPPPPGNSKSARISIARTNNPLRNKHLGTHYPTTKAHLKIGVGIM